MNTQKKHYLVDLENTGPSWKNIVPNLNPGDKVTVFYSDKTGTVNTDIPYTKIDVRKCYTGKLNAMDVQIMAELGRLSVTEPGYGFVVLTDDNGFNPITFYMADHGISVHCLSPKQFKTDIGTEPKSKPEEEDRPLFTWYRNEIRKCGIAEKDLDTTTKMVYAVMGHAKRKRCKKEILNGFSESFGNFTGLIRFQTIESFIDRVVENGPYPCSKTKSLATTLQAAGITLQKGTVDKAQECLDMAKSYRCNREQILHSLIQKSSLKITEKPKIEKALLPFL